MTLCVCMCVCRSLCHTWILSFKLCVHMCVWMCVCMHVCMPACVCICVVWVWVCRSLCHYMHMIISKIRVHDVCVCVWVWVCVSARLLHVCDVSPSFSSLTWDQLMCIFLVPCFHCSYFFRTIVSQAAKLDPYLSGTFLYLGHFYAELKKDQQ